MMLQLGSNLEPGGIVLCARDVVQAAIYITTDLEVEGDQLEGDRIQMVLIFFVLSSSVHFDR